MDGAFWTVLSIVIALSILGFLYLWFIIRHSRRTGNAHPPEKICLLTVLGSGGHTTEMLDLMKHLDSVRYAYRIYVVAATDKHSQNKALEAEKDRAENVPEEASQGEFSIQYIPRSREVGQSYITSVFTTILACVTSFTLVWKERPTLVLVNGPGTCIPVCICAVLLDVFRLTDTRIVYVESVCRVEKLSLSASLLYYSGLADDVVVLWPQLKDLYPRAITIEELS